MAAEGCVVHAVRVTLPLSTSPLLLLPRPMASSIGTRTIASSSFNLCDPPLFRKASSTSLVDHNMVNIIWEWRNNMVSPLLVVAISRPHSCIFRVCSVLTTSRYRSSSRMLISRSCLPCSSPLMPPPTRSTSRICFRKALALIKHRARFAASTSSSHRAP